MVYERLMYIAESRHLQLLLLLLLLLMMIMMMMTMMVVMVITVGYWFASVAKFIIKL